MDFKSIAIEIKKIGEIIKKSVKSQIKNKRV